MATKIMFWVFFVFMVISIQKMYNRVDELVQIAKNPPPIKVVYSNVEDLPPYMASCRMPCQFFTTTIKTEN